LLIFKWLCYGNYILHYVVYVIKPKAMKYLGYHWYKRTVGVTGFETRAVRGQSTEMFLTKDQDD